MDCLTEEELSRLSESAGNGTGPVRPETSINYGLGVVVTLSVFLALSMVLALVGNVMVIITIARHRGMRTRTNLLLANLAIADILVAVLDMPIAIATIVHGDWPFTQTFCYFNAYTVGLGLMLSVHTLMFISIHKYISITRPFSHSVTPTKIMMMIVAAWTWTIFFNLTPTPIIGWTTSTYKRGASQCGPCSPKKTMQFVHAGINTLVNLVIPIIVMSYCYYCIFKEVRDHLSRMRDFADVSVRNSLIQQKRITETLCIVMSIFILFWTPYIIYSLSLVFLGKEKVPEIFNPIAYLFGYMNSACNPIIYALRSPSFRRGFSEMICRNYGSIPGYRRRYVEGREQVLEISKPEVSRENSIVESHPEPEIMEVNYDVDCPSSSLNCTEIEELDEDKAVHPAMIVQAFVMSVCFLVGLVGNGAVAILVAVRHRLQTVTNLYLLNFAISSILAVLTNPVAVITIAKQTSGGVKCIVSASIFQVGMLTGSIFLTFISIDCYIGTRQQHHSPTYRWKMFKVVTGLAWGAGALFIVPVYFSTEYSASFCIEGPMFSSDPILNVTCAFVFFILPLILIWIYVSLCFPPKVVGSADSAGESPDASVIESRRLLVSLSVAFTVCQLPFWLMRVISLIYVDIYLHVTVWCLIEVNRAINSILIIIYNRDIRRELTLCLPSRASRMLSMETL